VKSEFGLTGRVAPNRIDAKNRKHPCPPEKRPVIEEAMRRLMIYDFVFGKWTAPARYLFRSAFPATPSTEAHNKLPVLLVDGSRSTGSATLNS